jgi:type I restriction enzyme S subunit
MTLDTFFKKFDQFANAPDAVAKMRELVLQLAVQGKLVSQNPKDEDASALRTKIGKTKELLISKRAIRRQDTAPIDGDDAPFSIPQSWIWTRLGEIADWGSGSTPSRGNSDLYDGGIAWLKSGELNDNQSLAGSEETVTEKALTTGSFRRNKPGDVLLAMYGATIGKVAILAEPAVTNQAVCGCTPFEGVFNRYLFSYLLSQRARFHSASEGGAQPNISKVKIVAFPFPLPPLAEQKRIVAKVDELMALCDRLEAQQQERDEQASALARASLARFAEAPTPANLNLLFGKSYSISPADLRKSILALAVRGRLVSQDPKDEPVEKLLAKMLKSKVVLIDEKKADEINKLHIAAKANPPDWHPAGWEWCRFWDVIWCYRGHNPPKSEFITEPRPGYVRFVQITDFKTDSRAVYVRESRHNKMVHKGEIIMAAYRHIGKLSRQMEGAFNVALCKVTEISPMSRDFVELLIGTELVKGELLAASERAHIPSMHSGHLLSLWVPIPPLAEQRRIVAKVDQLMALVDQLETQLAASRATSKNLLEALVAELT